MFESEEHVKDTVWRLGAKLLTPEEGTICPGCTAENPESVHNCQVCGWLIFWSCQTCTLKTQFPQTACEACGTSRFACNHPIQPHIWCWIIFDIMVTNTKPNSQSSGTSHLYCLWLGIYRYMFTVHSRSTAWHTPGVGDADALPMKLLLMICLLYTFRAHETKANLVCRLLLEKKKKKNKTTKTKKKQKKIKKNICPAERMNE